MTAATADALPQPAPRPSRLARLLLVCTVAELVLLGSGRLLQVGPLTARMGLFGLGLVYATYHTLVRRRVDVEYGGALLAFCTVTLLGALVGFVGGAPLAQIAEDVKPLAFFLSLAFFAAAIQTVADVERVAAVVRACSLALGVAYLCLIAAWLLGVLPFGPVYALLASTGEFMFRGSAGFFYKGFVYLGVGIFFFAFRPGWLSRLAAAVLFVALAATLTRGMLLATVLVLAAAVMIRQRNVLLTAVLTATLATGSVAAWFSVASAFENHAEGDAVRLTDLHNVIDATTWWSMLVGHGLGSSVGDRDRIEATYLEFWHQQGVVGLAFWGMVFALVVRAYLRARRTGHTQLAEPFFLGSTFVFLESATNPFLTNPIGMSLVLLSLVCLRVLGRGDEAGADRTAANA